MLLILFFSFLVFCLPLRFSSLILSPTYSILFPTQPSPLPIPSFIILSSFTSSPFRHLFFPSHSQPFRPRPILSLPSLLPSPFPPHHDCQTKPIFPLLNSLIQTMNAEGGKLASTPHCTVHNIHLSVCVLVVPLYLPARFPSPARPVLPLLLLLLLLLLVVAL